MYLACRDYQTLINLLRKSIGPNSHAYYGDMHLVKIDDSLKDKVIDAAIESNLRAHYTDKLTILLDN